MKKTASFIATVAALVATPLALPASAQNLLFQDDFQSATLEGPPATPPWSINEGTGGENFLRVRQDTSEILRNGTENQYVEFNGVDSAMAMAAGLPESDAEVVTLSFDFYEIDDGKNGPLVVFLYTGDGTTRAERLRLNSGAVQGGPPTTDSDWKYSLDSLTQIDWVYNNGTENFAYLSDTRLLEPGRSDLWINGRLVLGNHDLYEAHTAGPIRGLDFRTFSSNNAPQTVLLDNIRLLSGAEVRLKDPLIELRFDGNLVNTGTLGGEATFVHERESNPTYNWVWQNRASLGEGLGGEENSGLDNTQVGGMGNYGQGDIREGGVFYQPGDGLHGLRSITLSGWFKAPAGIPWSQEAYMIGRTNGIDYYHQTGTGQRLILSVPYGQPAIVRREFSGPTANGITPWQQVTDQWVFHAATFDGTTGTASFYYAYEDSETVIHDVTRTGMDVADLRDLSLQIAFGNTYFGTRPFKGHLDNMRVFGSTEDGSGALSQAQLAYLWARDLTGEEPPSGLQVRIIAIDHDGSNFTISYETDIGVTYTIERSTDLVNWETIATVAGDGTNQVHSDPVAGADRQFYRIQAESTH